LNDNSFLLSKNDIGIYALRGTFYIMMNESQDTLIDQDTLVKKTKKNTFQKAALFSAAGSIILAIASVIYLVLNIDTLGWENPISASLLASTFFFLFVALVLVVIGTTNIPSFKIGED